MVHPDFRQRGLGLRLFAKAASQLEREGHERVGLRVMSDNLPAVNLYQKLGFTAGRSST